MGISLDGTVNWSWEAARRNVGGGAGILLGGAVSRRWATVEKSDEKHL